MIKIKRWFKDFFNPEQFNDLDLVLIAESFSDQQIRGVWLSNCLEEIRRINLEVDKRMLLGSEMNYIDLCARRKAFQDILEMVLSARRTVTGIQRPNPRIQSINLDRVTA